MNPLVSQGLNNYILREFSFLSKYFVDLCEKKIPLASHPIDAGPGTCVFKRQNRVFSPADAFIDADVVRK